MDIVHDITYCVGRPNTKYEERCKSCERYIKLHDFRGQIFSIANLSPKNGNRCENFMKRKKGIIMEDVFVRDINIGQVLVKDNIKYIVLDKETNESDNYYDYLIITKLDNFKLNNEINLNYTDIIMIHVGEDWCWQLEDFIITNEKYNVGKVYRIY